MEKTAKQIEKDVFRIIKSSVLRDNVKGKFYRDGTRPKDASTEDVVVKFQTGVDGQEQSGVVLVHIYVPNVPNKDGETIEDIPRIDHLENLLNQVVSEINDTEYLFDKDGTPQSYPVEGISQHFINMRLYYRRKTF